MNNTRRDNHWKGGDEYRTRDTDTLGRLNQLCSVFNEMKTIIFTNHYRYTDIKVRLLKTVQNIMEFSLHKLMTWVYWHSHVSWESTQCKFMIHLQPSSTSLFREYLPLKLERTQRTKDEQLAHFSLCIKNEFHLQSV